MELEYTQYMLSNFKQNVMRIMREENLSLADLSRRTGICSNTISNLLHNNNQRSCLLETAIGVAVGLGVDFCSLFEMSD